MAEQNPNWSYNEFLAFLLLYAAHADFEIAKEEKEFLFSRIDRDEYKTVVKDFRNKNDYDRLEVIQSFRDEYYKHEDAKEKLLLDLKEMFLADNSYNSIENAVFTGLRRILL